MTPAEQAYNFLSGGLRLRILLNSRLARIAELREETRAAAAALQGMPPARAGGRGSAEIAERLADAQAGLTEEILDLLDESDMIRKVIGQVADPDRRVILETRYLASLPWKKIVALTGYSESTVMDKHRRALEDVAGIMGFSFRGRSCIMDPSPGAARTEKTESVIKRRDAP